MSSFSPFASLFFSRTCSCSRIKWIACLAGDLVLHVFEEQALLLWYELHLDRVQVQQFVQRPGHRQRVLLSRLHPQRSQVPRLPELRPRQLCQAQNQRRLLTFVLSDDKSGTKPIAQL